MWLCDDGTRVVSETFRADLAGSRRGAAPASASASRSAARARWRRMRRATGVRPSAAAASAGRCPSASRTATWRWPGGRARSAPHSAPPSSWPAGLLVGVVREGRGDLLQGLPRRRSPPAREPARLVAGDHRQPRRDVARHDAADRGEGPQPRLLDGVVGVVAVAEDERAEPPQAGVVAPDEARQRGVVTVAGGECEAHVDVWGGEGGCHGRRLTPRPRPRRP